MFISYAPPTSASLFWFYYNIPYLQLTLLTNLQKYHACPLQIVALIDYFDDDGFSMPWWQLSKLLETIAHLRLLQSLIYSILCHCFLMVSSSKRYTTPFIIFCTHILRHSNQRNSFKLSKRMQCSFKDVL